VEPVILDHARKHGVYDDDIIHAMPARPKFTR
jgi:hypothetical protein